MAFKGHSCFRSYASLAELARCMFMEAVLMKYGFENVHLNIAAHLVVIVLIVFWCLASVIGYGKTVHVE